MDGEDAKRYRSEFLLLGFEDGPHPVLYVQMEKSFARPSYKKPLQRSIWVAAQVRIVKLYMQSDIHGWYVQVLTIDGNRMRKARRREHIMKNISRALINAAIWQEDRS